VIAGVYEAISGDDELAHLKASIAAYREAGVAPPASLYASVGNVAWRPGGLRVEPDRAEVGRLLEEGLAAARAENDPLLEATVLAYIAMSNDSPDRRGAIDRRDAMFGEVKAIVDRATDQVPYVELMSYLASNEQLAGNVRGAQESLRRAAAIAATDVRAPIDTLYYQIANNAFALGDLDELAASTVRYERAVATAGPHIRMHAQRSRALLALCRGDWPAARAVARHVASTVDEHPETVFCVASAISLAWGASAAALSSDMPEAHELRTRAQRIAAQPNVSEVVIVATLATIGMRGDVLRIADQTPGDAWPTLMAQALATIDEWERVRGLLPALDEMAAGSHRYAEALTAALREELAARDGGPPAGHTALLEMGYVGISEMLRFRPPTWS
jgi:hypothetical protein